MYYYFTSEKIANITIHAGSGAVFLVQLHGSFWVDGLPLMDKALYYEKKCIESCVIDPVLPARYTLSLTSSGKAIISDTILVNMGEKISKVYHFENDISFAPVGTIHRDEELGTSLVENAKKQNLWDFTLIGTDIQNRIWVRRSWEKSTQIGILSVERFTPIRSIITPIVNASLDESRSVLVFDLASSRTLLLPITLEGEREIPTISWIRVVTLASGDIWKIRTDSGSMDIKNDRLIEDIRFTDAIDLSNQIRIWYIDKNDIAKLSLGNFPSTTSILIRLNRATGESVVLRTGFDIRALFFYQKKPAYFDDSGNIFIIEGK